MLSMREFLVLEYMQHAMEVFVKSESEIKRIFEGLWQDYIALNPQVTRIHEFIEKEGEVIENDHIALRTFNRPGIGVEALSEFFIQLGYTYGEEYLFEQKKLKACHLNPPKPGLPKVFISELLLDQCSEKLVEIVDAVLSQVSPEHFETADFLWSGRPWSPISYQVYDFLRQESEYAGWMYVFGYRANHFTVNVNKLKQTHDLAALNKALKSEGFALNTSGGEIKGGPDVYLSQSSTIADKVPVEFVEGTYSIPSCFYEFALRHALPGGELYGGFVAGNADKIFESTDSKAGEA